MPNPANDHLEIFEDSAGEWRWRRVDNDNGEEVAQSSESYKSHAYARQAARAYNAGLPVRDE